MPVYEYLCDACGPFTDMRPMAEVRAAFGLVRTARGWHHG